MKRILMFLAGGVFLVVLAPLFVTGFGEAAMALPLAGACIAALAGYLLRLKR